MLLKNVHSFLLNKDTAADLSNGRNPANEEDGEEKVVAHLMEVSAPKYLIGCDVSYLLNDGRLQQEGQKGRVMKLLKC